MPKNTRPRVWRFVKPFSDSDLVYGFQSGADDTVKSALGQTDIADSTPVQNLVLEPNNFKPHEMRKQKTAGSEGSYVAAASMASAKTAGFKIAKRGYKPKKKKSTPRSQVVYVTLNGIKYGWRLVTGSAIPIELGALGIVGATGAEDDIIFGATFPKPPRVKKISDNQEDSVEVFCDPSKVDTAGLSGWMLVDEGNYTAAHLVATINR